MIKEGVVSSLNATLVLSRRRRNEHEYAVGVLVQLLPKTQ